jgi:hypothetical protein
MFPHRCGYDLADDVRKGADPLVVVPDDFFVVRGGTTPAPDPGVPFSASTGPTLEAAACAVPHGTIRLTTAGNIRHKGGKVMWVPETSPHGSGNRQHVEIIEAGSTEFLLPMQNTVPKRDRIDGTF